MYLTVHDLVIRAVLDVGVCFSFSPPLISILSYSSDVTAAWNRE